MSANTDEPLLVVEQLADSSLTSPVEPTSEAASPPVEEAATLPATEEMRTAVPGRQVVLINDGSPMPVLWRWIPAVERLDAPRWRLQDWGFVRGCELGSGKLVEGSLELAAPDGPHILWIFPNAGTAQWLVVEAGDDGLELELAGTELAEIIVERDGVPAAGALVELFARGADAGGSGAASIAPKTYYRSLIADEDGIASVERWPGQVAIQARLGDAVSPVRFSSFVESFEIELLESFELSGRVGDGSQEVPGAWVDIGRIDDGQWRIIEQAPVALDGSYDAGRVPVPSADEIFVALSSDGSVAPQMIVRPRPEANERVTVDFDFAAARELRVRVVDEAGGPLDDVQVGYTLARGTEFEDSSDWVTPDADGEVVFPGVRVGYVELFTQREGFGEQAWGNFAPDSWADEPVTLRYLPDGEVVVRVERANGQPVDGFTLWQWEEHPSANQRIDVGGSSRRLRLQAGTHFVMVHGDGLARSEPVAIEVGAEPLDDVVFQLEPLRRAHGRVVDVDGQPFVGGLVQPWVNAGSQLLEKYGPPLVADESGRFEGRFLADGDNRVTVFEEGRKGAIYAFHSDDERSAALGDLPIYPARDMTLALAPALAATGEFRLSMDGGVRQMAERATVDGALVIDAAAPGAYVTSVRHPDGSFTGFRMVQHPAGPWTRMIGSTYDASYAFDPEALPESMRDEVELLRIAAYDPELETPLTRVVVLAKKGDIGFLPHGRLQLEWTDANYKLFARSFIDVASGERFTATPDDEFRDVVLRFVQPDGRALAGATIYYGYREMPGGFEATVQTGPDGRATVPDVSGNTLLLGVGHQSVGYAFGLETTFAGTNEADVVVATDSSCSIRLVDDERPVTGVEVYLACAQPRTLLFPTVPDDEGWARFGRLGAGRYRVVVRVPGYFPLDEIVEVAGRTKRTFELRSTGDLQLAFTRRGAPAVGVPFQLTEERTGDDVTSWLEVGQVRGAASADGGGLALLEGLPHGTYVLHVEGQRQRFELAAGQRTEKRIELE